MGTEKRLIDANALLTKVVPISNSSGNVYSSGVPTIEILKAPTVDAVEVVHGRWIDVRGIPSVNRKDVPIVKCSKCEIYFCDLINNHHYMYHYCPNCGAKMDGDGNG